MKIAVVSGASYGLGKALSEKLLKEDFKVYGISRTDPKLSNSQFIWIKADLALSKEITMLSEKIIEEKIDVLVNNAGTCFLRKTLEYTDDDFEKMFSLNFRSPIKLATVLFSKLRNGLIINISSISDRYPDSDYGLYGSTKTALNLFFETMATENVNTKIVNLLPSYIDTPLQHKLSDNKTFDWQQCMSVDEVAESVVYIVSHKNEVSSGSRIIIIKNAFEDNNYNPEDLWVYTTSDKTMKKLRNK
jgi:benzil reductase ((S)-benzoin forming)